MTYALISTDGELTFAHGEWRSRIGPEGSSRVPLMPESAMSGFVNDCGLVLPDRYARNVIGGLVLACLGGTVQPYAGPVVVTGWHECASCGPGEAELGDREVSYLSLLVDDLGRALDGRPVSEEMQSTNLAESIRKVAEVIRTGDVPPIVIHTTGVMPSFGGLN